MVSVGRARELPQVGVLRFTLMEHVPPAATETPVQPSDVILFIGLDDPSPVSTKSVTLVTVTANEFGFVKL
jgi:hypothetical protein